MDTILPSRQTAAHRLDPLSAAEIEAAAAILRRRHDLGAGMRFETIVLDEPGHNETDPPRRAFVACYDTASGHLFEAVVALDTETVLSWRQRPGARPRIAADEFLMAEERVRRHPDFVAAIAARGIADMSLVCVDPWSSGVFDESVNRHRLIQCFIWVRARPFDNQFAHPVEGLTALYDVDADAVVRIEDRGAVPVPMAESNYAARFQESFRPGLKPIEVVQPQGASFTVDGYGVAWCGWRFRVGFTPREGLVLHDLSIADGDRQRPVLRRAAVAEMIVPYGSPHGPHPRKNAFDCGEYGIGALANSLELGCDCLGVIQYFDAVVNDTDGRAQTIRNAVCLHEEDSGILWKHTDFRTGVIEVRRGRRLVISFIATVGNYEYGFYWHLSLDGTVALEVKLTGIINTAGIVPNEGTRHGTEIMPGVLGHIHHHIFSARLDMAVDGPCNTVMETDTVTDPPGPHNPWHNAFHAEETPLLTELAAIRDADESRLRTWRVVNRTRRGPTGLHPGYRLVPHSAMRAMAPPGSQMARRGAFAMHTLWVTPTRADERWPAGDYVNQSEDGQGLPAWTARDRGVADTAITLWHSFGHHHIVRPEDFPVQPVVTCGFLLQPVAFFARQPDDGHRTLGLGAELLRLSPAPAYPDTHYARTLADKRVWPAPDGVTETETCVIGGGLAGLATALDLAERGRGVTLLEAGRIGAGASGRNGGFVSDGYALEVEALERLVGPHQSREMHALTRDAVTLLRARIARYGIACGSLPRGVMRVAFRGRPARLEAWRDRMARDYAAPWTYWPAARVREALATERYADALVTEDGFAVHPLNLSRGLAVAAERQGARIHEGARVRGVRPRAGGGWTVRLRGAETRCDNVVVACGGYVGPQFPRLWAATVKAATFVMVTPPLGDRLPRAIAVPHAIHDLKFATNYYRRLDDGRLLWGGRVLGWSPPAALVAQWLQADMAAMYPDLRGVAVEVAWTGLMAYLRHRMCVVGQTAPGLWHAAGFGGHGLALTTMAGRLIGAAIDQGDDRWRMFAQLGLPFAAGPLGRVPAQAVFWRQALADRSH